MLGGVVEFQTAKHAPGFRRGQSAVKGRRAVGRELVEHDADLLGLGEMDIAKLAHAFSEVRCRAALGDLDLAPGLQAVLRGTVINSVSGAIWERIKEAGYGN